MLDLILSGEEREKVVIKMNDYLSDLGTRMKNGGVPLTDYIITKQLTRDLASYD